MCSGPDTTVPAAVGLAFNQDNAVTPYVIEQARRHGFRAGGARKIWRALSLFFDDYGAL